MFGSERQFLPWIRHCKSNIDDWDVIHNSDDGDMEESVSDLFTKYSDERVTILMEGGPSTGKTSLLHQICLDWGRSASYLQHFALVIFIDCINWLDRDLDKHVMKTYKVIKQEKLNLQKWEVQKEPFLLVLDNLHKIR